MMYYLIALFIAAADRIVKWRIVNTLEKGQAIGIIPGFLRITRVENSGAALSLFADAQMRWVLVALSAVCSVILVFVLQRYKHGAVGRVGAAMALGGAVGNLIDRALLGYVVDMFDLSVFSRSLFVFNIADLFITCGILLLALHYFQSARREIAPKEHAADTQGADEYHGARPSASLYEDDELTETRILEEFDLERRISQYDDDADGGR